MKKTDGQKCPFTDTFNKDVIQKVTKYLAANDVVALGSTCEKMRVLSNSESVWFHLLIRDYGVKKDPVFDGGETFKEIYKQENNFEEYLEKIGYNLYLSCSNGMIEDVKCWIRRGANIDQADNIGMTALMSF